MSGADTVIVVGLGYGGLPLAMALAKHGPVLGFDISTERIAELKRGHDRTSEVTSDELVSSSLALTDDAGEIGGSNVLIITVPTPVGPDNKPDLSAVIAASETVGAVLKPGAIVVYESTVYPGVTEDICGPVLERASGFRCGVDFFLGYSPERINPGDREHTVDRITKIVAGQTPEVLERLVSVYGAINGGDIHRAQDIRTAEAAKVIENAQRDINIAFVNEVAMILGRMGINANDVLDAANTKWNFLPFRPGLVGGHCIGVDPYY
ncbi:MAG: nucleotide sugar dehydrogenase, partial [Alphaproteobacteria bacterium]|nr:nucleotide sugar dehydrogenase [Alphaproteobacteria bacterium]